METSLHKQLKEHYARDGAQTEVVLGKYRIDVIHNGTLIEIQHGSLAAIRDKVQRLLTEHRVLVVKPIIAAKTLLKQERKDGPIVSRRKSPKHETVLDLFGELIYFTRVFPHRRLRLEVPLVEVEEIRYPGHGRRRYRRDSDFQISDQRLVRVLDVQQFDTATDLCRLLPDDLPRTFHTGDLSAALQVQRFIAQKIVYCLRKFGSIRQVGKQGNAALYRRSRKKIKAA